MTRPTPNILPDRMIRDFHGQRVKLDYSPDEWGCSKRTPIVTDHDGSGARHAKQESPRQMYGYSQPGPGESAK